MSSMQESKGAGKAAKFVAANPLGPMADPFAGLDDDQKEYQKAVAENVNKRMETAMGDLKKKYAKGDGGNDAGDNGPTGDAYRKHQNIMAKKRQDAKDRSSANRAVEVQHLKAERENLGRGNGEDDDSDDSEDEYDALLDECEDDPELDALRNTRIQALKAQQSERAENLGKGHGQYRMISQDEFLPEVTSSPVVCLHFYHREFLRCKIMDHHLDLIAPLHVECKFIKIDAEKCPFFVQKLQVQVLPTVVIFKDGVAQDRLQGFQGLSHDMEKPDEFHTSKLRAWLSQVGAIKYTIPTEEIRVEMKRLGMLHHGSIYSADNEYNSDEDGD